MQKKGESAILQQTGRISSRLCVASILLLSYGAAASPLFEDEALLDVTLSGPLGRIGRDRKDDERIKYPFTLTVDGTQLPVMVRVRGNSRTVLCSFPPLRLEFEQETAASTPFAGQDRLKLVTHCENDEAHFENNVLDEFVAYRIFNVISDAGYRVRLLHVTYEDTDERYRHLDRPYYAFLVESDDELAARLGGTIAKQEGVYYSRLNDEQTARLGVFEYLIANLDWSFVRNPQDDECCHNIDLVDSDDGQLPVPRDFDMSGLVDARYAKPPAEMRVRSVRTRTYIGYCKTSIASVAAALDDIVGLREEIMAVAASTPALSDRDLDSRVEYIGRFFDEAADDRAGLLESFGKNCIGDH